MKTTIEQSLADYLTGYTRNNPAGRDHLISYSNWQTMAQLELDRRASSLLSVLPDAELQAIAEGAVNLADIARGLPA
ncbi:MULTISPECIES: hypothetical protein [unclassified Pseudomonas]|uniref:hypothetical protein n=1 Tax=unclassified Pseudomonas TaxID=196821 RepID=UPI00244B9417|nr:MULTISPECIES: hypothetical protein [unclassified Pseudomonas]MDG9928558.1 hypothetical protein [Pseudomonas sp. GD04042]MDH0482728.1 hypothetical protein [Pseudomonas sp. GD04015]MDH0604570.1 hypothetical protein [Pseudomonas sp. GD03869]